jgi:hypothetical protein
MPHPHPPCITGYRSQYLASAYILSDLAIDLQASKIRHTSRIAGKQRRKVLPDEPKKTVGIRDEEGYKIIPLNGY